MCIGTRISNYRILSQTPLGELGPVYKAVHETSRDSRWLKILSAKAMTPALKQEILDRAQRATSLKNSHILGNSPPELADSLILIPLDFIEGFSLYSKIQEGCARLDFALEIGLNTADALADAHDAGLVHGELTPGKLFLASGSHLKIAGFHLSSYGRNFEEHFQILPLWSNKSAPISLRLFPEIAYLAPERIRGDSPAVQSDLFSLGVILYELLTGEFLFQSGSPDEIKRLILEQPIPQLKAKRPDIPEIWNRILKALLIRDTAKRYPSARDLLNDLQQVRWGFSIERPAFLSKNPNIHRRGFFRRLKPDLDLK